MSKLPYLSMEDLSEEDQPIYTHIAATRGTMLNLHRMLFNNPKAAELVTDLGEYIRYRSPLDDATREIIILSTAREINNEYEWTQHKPEATKAGVNNDVIEFINSGKQATQIHPRERTIIEAVKQIVQNRKLNDATFESILNLLGTKHTLEFVIIVAYYSMIGLIIDTIGVELEDGKESSLKV